MSLKQILDLNKELEDHNHNYYILNNPTISDEVYDSKLVRLRDMVKSYGKPVTTILDTVGSDLSGQGKEVKHIRPMLSIRTEVDTSETPLNKFLERCAKEFPSKDLDFIAEHKYDGLATSLIYNTFTGRPIQAVTRGDGLIGEDITLNVLRIPNIVGSRPFPGDMKISEVRGEVLMLRDLFEKANEFREKNGDKRFINTRNATAGIIRKVDQQQELLDTLVFIPYAMYGEDDRLLPDTQVGQLELLYEHLIENCESLNSIATPKVVKGPALYEEYLNIKGIRDSLTYDIDGVVYKMNSIEDQEQFGISGREPRWSIAHKLPAEVKSTKLLKIDVQVGPSGRLTPMARLEPVFVGGVTVTNCSLSNIFVLRKKGVREGDMVLIQRAGDVIPEITGVAGKRSGYTPNFRMPKVCPECGGEVLREKEMMNHQCVNTYGCPAQAYKLFANIASGTMLDIEGLGESNCQKLYESGFKHFHEFFTMQHPGWEIANLGPETTKNLKANLIKAAITPIGVDMFFRLLGIHHLGRSSSKKIAAYVGSFDKFLVTTPSEYKKSGVPSNVIRNIEAFIINSEAVEHAERLHERLTIVNYEENTDGVLAGKTVVLTGSPTNLSKAAYEKAITQMGGSLASSVSKNTGLVIYGDGAGSKLDKAISLGIERYTYDEFIKHFDVRL